MKFIKKYYLNFISLIPYLSIPFILFWLITTDFHSGIMKLLMVLILFVISILFYLLIDRLIKQKKYIKFSISLIILSLLLGASSFASKVTYDIGKTLKELDDKQDTTTIDISFVTLNDSSIMGIENINNVNVGLLFDDNSYEGNIIPLKVIYQNELDVTTFYADEYHILIKDLIEGKYDVIALPTNYKDVFEYDENVKPMLPELRTIFSYQEDVTIEVEEKEILTGDKPFNILLVGTDNPIYKNRTDGHNYDAIILLTVNPNTGDIALTSIMRDTFVYSECIGGMDKINHNGWLGKGIHCLTDVVEDIFEIDVNYYMMVDFRSIVKIVDKIGGITIDNPFAFTEQNSNRVKGTVYVPAGINLLNGEQALAFARNRKNGNGPKNAEIRSQNHLVVVEAIARQLISAETLKDYDFLLDIVKNYVVTDIPGEQFKKFFNVANTLLNNINYDIKNLNIEKLSMKGETKWQYSYGLGAPNTTFVVYEESYQKVKRIINTFSEVNLPIISDFEFDLTKSVNSGMTDFMEGTDVKDPRRAKNLVGLTEDEAKRWALSLAFFSLNIKYEYSDTVQKGIVMWQEIAGGHSLNNKSSIRVTISKGKKGEYLVLPDMTNWYVHDIEAYIYNNLPNGILQKYTPSDAEKANYVHNTFAGYNGYKANKEIYKYDNVIVYVAYMPDTITPTPPALELKGDLSISLNVGDAFVEPGYYAWDTIDWYMGNQVEVTSDLDTEIAGTYTITYKVTNSSGLSTELTREIIVVGTEETQDDTEPSDTEPSDTEPSDTEPSDTEPSDTEPSDTEPSDTEPSGTEPSDTGDGTDTSGTDTSS